MRAILLAAAPFVAAAIAGCGDGGGSAAPTVTVPVVTAIPTGVSMAASSTTVLPTATETASDGILPAGVADAINAFIASGGLPELLPGHTLVAADCSAVNPGDACLWKTPAIGQSEVTVYAAVSQSDVSWEIRLEQRAGAWTVVDATYTGCC